MSTAIPSSTLGALSAVVDADTLSELTGMSVRAVRLRIKPEVSLMVALADRSTGRAAGWARLLWPVSASKALKTQKRADRHGIEILTRRLRDGLILQAGPVAADPKLSPYLGRARERGLLGPWHADDVLRYNPARRLVLRLPVGVLRIRAAAGRRLDEIHHEMGRIVPVPPLKDLGAPWDSGHYSLQEECGTTNLERSPDLGATRRAGALLARLHSWGPPAALTGRLDSGPVSARELARTHARILAPLSAELARRTRELAHVLPAELKGPAVLIHGDASPDQVLHDPRSGRIWLTDFDRARLAPAAADLGSYLALCPAEAGQALIEGYREGGGGLPDANRIRHAIALSELSRLVEPLRHADPGWADAIDARLARLESWPAVGSGPEGTGAL